MGEAANYSLAQLKLSAAANSRVKARDAMTLLDIIYAAVVGAWSDKGRHFLRRIRAGLESKTR